MKFFSKWKSRRHRPLRALQRIEDSIKLLHRSSAVGPDGIFTFPILGEQVQLYIPYHRFDYIQSEIILKSDFFEGELLRYIRDKYLTNQDRKLVIADIGGNIGNHAVFFGKFCNAVVYSFEPQREIFRILEKNMTLNGIDARIYNVAIGQKEGFARISRYIPTNIGGTSLQETSKTSDIKVLPLDFFNITPDLIKIDVEGFELKVIEGSTETLRKSNPLLWIETFPDKFDQTFSILKTMGYDLIEDLGEFNYIFKRKNSN